MRDPRLLQVWFCLCHWQRFYLTQTGCRAYNYMIRMLWKCKLNLSMEKKNNVKLGAKAIRMKKHLKLKLVRVLFLTLRNLLTITNVLPTKFKLMWRVRWWFCSSSSDILIYIRSITLQNGDQENRLGAGSIKRMKTTGMQESVKLDTIKFWP